MEKIKSTDSEEKQKFPNGFTSWQETHFEIVQAIVLELTKEDNRDSLVFKIQNDSGHGGLYELAHSLTNEFEAANKGRGWDGEFFDEIEKFIDTKFKEYNKSHNLA